MYEGVPFVSKIFVIPALVLFRATIRWFPRVLVLLCGGGEAIVRGGVLLLRCGGEAIVRGGGEAIVRGGGEAIVRGDAVSTILMTAGLLPASGFVSARRDNFVPERPSLSSLS